MCVADLEASRGRVCVASMQGCDSSPTSSRRCNIWLTCPGASSSAPSPHCRRPCAPSNRHIHSINAPQNLSGRVKAEPMKALPVSCRSTRPLQNRQDFTGKKVRRCSHRWCHPQGAGERLKAPPPPPPPRGVLIEEQKGEWLDGTDRFYLLHRGSLD